MLQIPYRVGRTLLIAKNELVMVVKHSSLSFLTGNCQIFGFQWCHQRYDWFPANPGLILLIVFLPLGTKSPGKMKKKNWSGIISALSCLHCRLNGWIQTHCFPLLLPVAKWKWESNLTLSLRQSYWEKKGVCDILDGYNLLFLQLYAKNKNPKIINHSITNPCNARHPSNSMLSRMCALRLITYCLFSSIFLEIFPPADTL